MKQTVLILNLRNIMGIIREKMKAETAQYGKVVG